MEFRRASDSELRVSAPSVLGRDGGGEAVAESGRKTTPVDALAVYVIVVVSLPASRRGEQMKPTALLGERGHDIFLFPSELEENEGLSDKTRLRTTVRRPASVRLTRIVFVNTPG